MYNHIFYVYDNKYHVGDLPFHCCFAVARFPVHGWHFVCSPLQNIHNFHK